MQHSTAWIGLALLIAGNGFSKTVVTARNHAEGSDVVLESAVEEIKSIPVDAANVVGDAVQIVVDETVNAVDGVKSVFSGATEHEKVKHAGELEIENAWNTADDIVFRSYKISDKTGTLLSGSGETSGSVDVSSFFDDVDFGKGASAFYMPKFNSLLVYQTLDNILAIEMTLAQYQGAHRELRDHQVEIETKFVEVSQSTLNELGFNWRFNSDLEIFDDLVVPGGQELLSSGLRTAATALNAGRGGDVLGVSKAAGSLRWDLFISALEQEDDTDVLSAPRVVTLDGNTATIHVGEKQWMPRAFGVNNKDTSAYIEHADWEEELLGVYMEVTPEIREEGLIDLELSPRVIDVIGYDQYGVTPAYSGSKDVGSIGNQLNEDNNFFSLNNTLGGFVGLPFSPNRSEYFPVGEYAGLDASLPYYRVRELETVVTVADGSTVGMGGLIYDKLESYRDKVPVLGSIPFLGRLFRSEGERSIKRNLMIFVTATQVDVDGRRTADVVLNK